MGSPNRKSSILVLNNQFKEDAVKTALEKLMSVVKEYPMGTTMGSTSTGGDNARYGAVCIDGDKQKLYYNCHPCHAMMANYPKPLVVFNQYGHRSFIKFEADSAWFDFITSNDGPWKEFANRTISHKPDSVKSAKLRDFIFENGWVWSDLKHPSNLQHNFLVATRMGTEWPKSIERWYEYVEEGCHPGMAFVFLDVFKEVQGDTKKWTINNTNKYDWPVDVCTSTEDYVRNFCLGKVEKLNKNYADNQRYTPVNRIFGENGLSSADDKSYPNRIFELYHDKYGPDEGECGKYWEKKGTGLSRFNYRTCWYVSEADIIRIIKSETKRLLGE